MEYVEVRFPQERPVYVDDVDSGMTNTILRIGTGTHAFHLGEPRDYRPTEFVVEVTNTNVLEPMVIEFDEVQS